MNFNAFASLTRHTVRDGLGSIFLHLTRRPNEDRANRARVLGIQNVIPSDCPMIVEATLNRKVSK